MPSFFSADATSLPNFNPNFQSAWRNIRRTMSTLKISDWESSMTLRRCLATDRPTCRPTSCAWYARCCFLVILLAAVSSFPVALSSFSCSALVGAKCRCEFSICMTQRSVQSFDIGNLETVQIWNKFTNGRYLSTNLRCMVCTLLFLSTLFLLHTRRQKCSEKWTMKNVSVLHQLQA